MQALMPNTKPYATALAFLMLATWANFILKGDKALDLIQQVTSNDASKLYDGKVQYSCLPNKDGGIVDDLLVYRIDPSTYMLVVNASNIEKDWNWISEFNTHGRGYEKHIRPYIFISYTRP